LGASRQAKESWLINGKQPTLRDVAQRAGVHAGTASRALNPLIRDQVSAETMRRVERAARDLGYQPNPIARSLRTARSNTVGLVIPDLTNPLFPPIVRGIESVLEPAGFSALIVNTDNDRDRERARIGSLRSRQIDGLIIATATLDDPLLTGLWDDGLRMVLINRRAAEGPIPSVVPDDESGITRAVDHLTGLGHTRIAHLSGPLNTSTGAARSRAFRHAISDHGLAGLPELVIECAAWSQAAGAAALRTLLARDTRFTAVVAGNDLIALGCYDIFAEAGLRCPADISVVGFNDMPFLDNLNPPLTTIRVANHDAGAEAARLLLAAIEAPARPLPSVLMPTSLVIRASTASPPQSG
jgi:LacI family transcriptional regulator